MVTLSDLRKTERELAELLVQKREIQTRIYGVRAILRQMKNQPVHADGLAVNPDGVVYAPLTEFKSKTSHPPVPGEGVTLPAGQQPDDVRDMLPYENADGTVTWRKRGYNYHGGKE